MKTRTPGFVWSVIILVCLAVVMIATTILGFRREEEHEFRLCLMRCGQAQRTTGDLK